MNERTEEAVKRAASNTFLPKPHSRVECAARSSFILSLFFFARRLKKEQNNVVCKIETQSTIHPRHTRFHSIRLITFVQQKKKKR